MIFKIFENDEKKVFLFYININSILNKLILNNNKN